MQSTASATCKVDSLGFVSKLDVGTSMIHALLTLEGTWLCLLDMLCRVAMGGS